MRTAETSVKRAQGGELPRISVRAGFWAIAFAFPALTAFSTTPSSLYGLYQERLHLSSITITLIYGVHEVGIFVSLLLAGHLSDWYGRSPLLLAALGVAVAAALLFLV